MVTPIPQPDLSARPLRLVAERAISASVDVLYRARTEHFDRWFAARGTVAMTAAVNAAFFFETHFDGQRHPHYGQDWVCSGESMMQGQKVAMRSRSIAPNPAGWKEVLEVSTDGGPFTKMRTFDFKPSQVIL